jgi:hypothetical protein
MSPPIIADARTHPDEALRGVALDWYCLTDPSFNSNLELRQETSVFCLTSLSQRSKRGASRAP